MYVSFCFSHVATERKKMQSLRTGLQSDRLATMFALPHEVKPIRLPTIPAVMTGTVDLMSDDTRSVSSSAAKRYALCRDACFPLWSDRIVLACGGIRSTGVDIGTEIGTVLQIPPLDTKFSAGRVVDGVILPQLEFEDLAVVLGRDDNTVLYIPSGSYVQLVVETGAAVAVASRLQVTLRSYLNGDWVHSTVTLVPSANQFIYCGNAGFVATTAGSLDAGINPVGFTQVVSARVSTAVATAAVNCNFKFGWSTSTNVIPAPPDPDEELLIFIPSFVPPEFRNSTLPYKRTRANATAMLATNVTPVLQKEGTILAARLQVSTVDMFAFAASNINSSHPSQRYFGALEAGVYTFTGPTAQIDTLDDCVGKATIEVPTFDYMADPLYNAIIFNDLDSTTPTTLAISLYTHLEFACTSSLFQIAVSGMSIETLHQAEVKLLRIGYFHENPKHVKGIADQLMAVIRRPARAMAQKDMVKQSRRPAPPKQKKKVKRSVKGQKPKTPQRKR